jgi:hypothetical protein
MRIGQQLCVDGRAAWREGTPFGADGGQYAYRDRRRTA